jgi:hypothetical protein
MVPNNDELYARKDIDAVLIATADFQHARHGIEAVNAGRDAYVEKPTAHTMDDARDFLAAVESSKQIVAVGTQRRSTPAYIKAAEYIQSGKFGDIVMVEMTWNVNQPGRWRRPDVVPTAQGGRHRLEALLPRRPSRPSSTRASILSSASSGPTPPAFPTSGSSTRSTPSTGSPACRIRARSSPTAASISGRTAAQNWDTMTAVFDYGPLDDLTKGFQVQYTSRFTNSAGGVKELYYSNGGMIDMDKQTVTPTGGLSAREAAAMKMQPNLLPSFRSWKSRKSSTDADTAAGHGDPRPTPTCATGWSASARARLPTPASEAGYSHSIALCMNVAAIQTGQKVTFDDKTQQVMVGGKVYA